MRGELDREFPFRITVKCRCGRGFGFVYGTANLPARWYWKGHYPYTFTSNGTARFTCSPRCRGDYPIRHGVFRAAYLATIAKPKEQRLLVLPYDVKGLEPVPGRQPPVGIDGSYIGGRRPVPAQHRAGPPTH